MMRGAKDFFTMNSVKAAGMRSSTSRARTGAGARTVVTGVLAAAAAHCTSLDPDYINPTSRRGRQS